MSTKTTLKRIALVAVSALGFGLMSVVPSNAAYTAANITIGTPSALRATVSGVTQYINVPVTIPTTANNGDSFTISGVLTAKPSTSTRALNDDGSDAPVVAVAGAGDATVKTSTTTITVTQDGTDANSADVALGAADMDTSSNTSSYVLNLTFTFTPDVAGTYVFAFFVDGDSSVSPTGLIKSGDRSIKYLSLAATSQPATTVVLSQPLAGTIATNNTSDHTNGGWVKVSVTDGTNASVIDLGQQVLVNVPSGVTLVGKAGSGAAVTGLSVTDATYALSNSDFDAYGNAYLNFTAAAAGSFAITATVSGRTAEAAGSVLLTYAAANKDAIAGNATTTPAISRNFDSGTGNVDAAATIKVNPSVSSNTYTVYAASADVSTASVTNYVAVTVQDTNGFIFGDLSSTVLTQDLAIALGTTAGSTSGAASNARATGSFTIPGALTLSKTSTENRYVVFGDVLDNTASTSSAVTTVVTPALATTDSLTITPADAVKVVNGGSITFTATVEDQYGSARAGIAVTAQISAGRNLQATATNLVTNADGEVSFTVTDAASTSSTLTSTVTFTTSDGTTDDAVISWVSSLTASTLTTTPSATTTTALTPSDFGGVNTATATASTGRDSVSAVVKDANGAVIAGMPLTLTVPSDVTIYSLTPAVAYTDATGTATWSVYTTKAGTYKFTVTGGGLSKDFYGKWSGSNARVVSVTAGTTSGDATPITIKASDAYGNGVGSEALTVSTDGGYFQGAALSSTISTDANGEIRLLLVGNGKVTATGTATHMFYGAALVGTTAAAGFPAGVNSASVTVSGAGSSASAAAAEAASDAAAEAIDAANAATDAANLAAEAADAATVAAEEARDAADAATAAVEELATQVATLMAALKAQITTLANTVAKIAKKVKA